MKELSIEEKAKAYDKAIESLRAAFYDNNNRMCDEYRDACKRIIEPIFPELKESEGERIKKAIIEHFEGSHSSMYPYKGFTKEQILAWLEAQGNPSIKWNKNTKGNKPQVNHSILMKTIYGVAEGEWNGKQWIQYRWSSSIKDSDVLDWIELPALEKHEQKPADKVEPKFKVGDWVVNNNGEPQLSQVISYSWPNSMIKRATNNLEIFINKATLDKQYHLWTIQDAKDGDVLYSKKHNIIWIYKDNEHYHACVNMNYVTENVATDSLIGIPNDVCPANRVQRSILFQKMEEAGYEWDAEKKELKKIEQKPTEWSLPYGKNETAEKLIALAECLEMDGDCLFNGLSGNDYGKFLRVLAIELTEVKPAWSEEDEKKINYLIALLQNSTMHNSVLRMANEGIENWLKSLKDRVGCEVNCTTTKEWSEDDEQYLLVCKNALAKYQTTDKWDASIISHWLENKLKSVNPQNTWKPSDEQMKQLGWIAKQNKDNMIGKELMTLYQDLLKQREE